MEVKFTLWLCSSLNFNLFLFADERKLGVDEKPLLVQLNWHKDDREGRFLLRRIDEKTNVNNVTERDLCIYIIIDTFF